MVREPDATMQPTPQDIQLMSKHRVLSLKPQLRLEWRGQDGQSETEQPDHSASLGDSEATSTRIKFSVHTGARSTFSGQPCNLCVPTSCTLKALFARIFPVLALRHSVIVGCLLA